MTERSVTRHFKTSPEVIGLAVMSYVRFPLAHWNLEDLQPERGIEIRPSGQSGGGCRAEGNSSLYNLPV